MIMKDRIITVMASIIFTLFIIAVVTRGVRNEELTKQNYVNSCAQVLHFDKIQCEWLYNNTNH